MESGEVANKVKYGSLKLNFPCQRLKQMILSFILSMFLWLQRPSVTADTMFYESAQQTIPARKGRMTDIPVHSFHEYESEKEDILHYFIISISVCVGVAAPLVGAGGAWGLEWQLPPSDRSSEGCPTSNRSGKSQPHPQLHHCPLLQVVQVGTSILHLCQMLVCSVWFTFPRSPLAMFRHFLFPISSIGFPPEQLSLLFHVLYATDFILQLLWSHYCLLYLPVITVSTLHTPHPFLCLFPLILL